MRWLCALAVATAGCSLPFDEFTSAAGDAQADSSSNDAATDSAIDSASDACVCVKVAAGKCRQYSPPGCM